MIDKVIDLLDAARAECTLTITTTESLHSDSLKVTRLRILRELVEIALREARFTKTLYATMSQKEDTT